MIAIVDWDSMSYSAKLALVASLTYCTERLMIGPVEEKVLLVLFTSIVTDC